MQRGASKLWHQPGASSGKGKPCRFDRLGRYSCGLPDAGRVPGSRQPENVVGGAIGRWGDWRRLLVSSGVGGISTGDGEMVSITQVAPSEWHHAIVVLISVNRIAGVNGICQRSIAAPPRFLPATLPPLLLRDTSKSRRDRYDCPVFLVR